MPPMVNDVGALFERRGLGWASWESDSGPQLFGLYGGVGPSPKATEHCQWWKSHTFREGRYV